jgi:cytochrome b
VSGAGEYRVWDLPVRVTHWSLVVLVALQYASGEYELFDLEWHLVLGQVTLMLVLFRVLWGLFGSENARFGHFLRGPRAVLRHAKGLFARTPAARAGHNPLGGWSALLMLLLLLLQGITGLFASDDIATAGPLADAVSDRTVRLLTRWHKVGQKALLVLIGLHLAGVAWHALYKREALVRPMFTGRRALLGDPGLRFAGAGRAVLLAAISVAAVWGLTTL